MPAIQETLETALYVDDLSRSFQFYEENTWARQLKPRLGPESNA